MRVHPMENRRVSRYPGAGVFKQLRLMLWKNWLLKRNKWVDTLIEISAPIICALILLLLRTLVSPTTIGQYNFDEFAPNLRVLQHSLMSDSVLLTWACGYNGGGGGFGRQRGYQAQIGLTMRNSPNPTLLNQVQTFLSATIQNQYVTALKNANMQNALQSGVISCPGSNTLKANMTKYFPIMFRQFDTLKDLTAFTGSASYAPLTGTITPNVNMPIAAAIVLDEPVNQKYGYDIYMNQTVIRPTDIQVNIFDRDFTDGSWANYVSACFSGLQVALDNFFVQMATGQVSSLPNILAAPMPISQHQADNFATAVGSVIGLMVTLSWLWPFSRLVRNMVEEKEQRIKEGLKMMGLSNAVFWLSWAITYSIQFLISCIIVTLILYKGFFAYVSFAVSFFIFILFSLSTVSLAILLTAFFSRAKTAGVLSMFFLLAIYLPFFAVFASTNTSEQKIGASILSPVAFSLGLSQMLLYQSNFTPLNSKSLGEMYQNYSMAACLGMLIFDSVLYLFLAWYFDNVIPQEFGSSRPFYFLFTKSYWMSFFDSVPDDETSNLIDPNDVALRDMTSGNFEPVSEELAAMPHISISHLQKQFPGDPTPHVAVKDLSMNIYEGQIFALLGHNGAGKTTTINMLTGMTDISNGTAHVYHINLATHLNEARKMYGVCPQHDILFPTLTVRDHLALFASLKGVPDDEIPDMVTKAIEEVQLTAEDGLQQEAITMSGGQKRRLCLAIALIAESKVVFLDEPTSGVDPFSRRAIWDLLVKVKKDRIIILTTHFMDEADQLGDRIAIMHHGHLKCIGSPLFLKSKYGVGYNITMTKEDHCDPRTVSQLVKEHVSTASLISSVGTELSFRLPIDASEHFPAMLRQLDKQKDTLGLVNYGISVTTMEEVFLKVAQENEAVKARVGGNDQTTDNGQDDEFMRHSIDPSALSASSEHQTFFRHVNALLIKRWNFSKRDTRSICCAFIVPWIILALGLGLLQIPTTFSFPRLLLAPTMYNSPMTVPYNGFVGNATQSSASVGQNLATFNTYTTVSMDNSGTFNTVASPLEFSTALLNRRIGDAKQSRYGAFMFGTSMYGNLYSTTLPGMGSSKFNASMIQFSNLTARQGLPVYTNLLSNLVLRSVTGNSQASITSAVKLFDWTLQQQQAVQSVNGLFSSIIIALAFCFVPASYVVFVVKERESKAKHLQLISGVGITPFWAANFIWDMICFSVVMIVASLIILAFNNDVFVKGDAYGLIWLNFFMFGLSVIPFSYCCSFLFTSHSTAQNVMIMIYLLGGLALVLVGFILGLLESTSEMFKYQLRYVFRILPNYCVCDTIMYMAQSSTLKLSNWDMEISGWNLLFMAVESVVYFVLAILIEAGMARSALVGFFKLNDAKPNKLSEMLDQMSQEKDADVEDEKTRMLNGEKTDDLIQLRGLRKVYDSGKVAVHDLWYSVPKNQCFGFLGVNGAGKSTALKILTGDELPTEGQAMLGGFNIANEPEAVRRLMGYCPQFDALHDLLTAKEHLEFYGRIRGVPDEKLDGMVNLLIKRLTLDQDDQHLRPAGTYSGGNKRKLSVAIALIGNPPVVFLDEPSTGMDPVSRRFLWNFMTETMTNRAVILTTHSMEECEALCSRIGILVLGKLKCLGSAQHLKTKFGHGLQLDFVLTSSEKVDTLKQFMHAQFSEANEIESFGGAVKFSIGTQANMMLADIFATIEANKAALSIQNYAVSQTSLEQIFIDFAKKGDENVLRAEHILNAGQASNLV